MQKLIVPSVIMHPHEGYYEAIAETLGLKIVRFSDYLRPEPPALPRKIWLVLRAALVVLSLYFIYGATRSLISKKSFSMWESVIDHCLAYNPKWEGRFRLSLFSFRCAYQCLKLRADLLSKNNADVGAWFITDQSYAQNYVIFSTMQDVVPVFTLSENFGLRILRALPGDRFFGDVETHKSKLQPRAISLEESVPVGDYWYMKSVPTRNKAVSIKDNAMIVFAHDFRDAPHFCKGNVFLDNVSWLRFVAKTCARSNRPLYIKWHPSSCDESKRIEKLQEIELSRFGVHFIPPSVGLLDLPLDKVLAILTNYGSIIFEAVSRGVRVIACADYMGDSGDLCVKPSTRRELGLYLSGFKRFPTIDAQKREFAKAVFYARATKGVRQFPFLRFSDAQFEAIRSIDLSKKGVSNTSIAVLEMREFSDYVLNKTRDHRDLWLALLRDAGFSCSSQGLSGSAC